MTGVLIPPSAFGLYTTMSTPNPVFKAHLRIARPAPSLLPFCNTSAAFESLFSVTTHAGFDGVILGHLEDV